MNIRFSLWLIITSALLALAGCEVSPPSPTATSTTTIPATLIPTPVTESGLNLLVNSNMVYLKRRVWSDYQSVAFGTTIRRGDLILPSAGETITILCADLTVYTIDQEAGSPCEATQPTLFWDEARIVPPRATSPDITVLRIGFESPYILHPRSTHILTERPWLRWHDTGASSYTVSIIQGMGTIWKQTGVVGTELRYPNDAPLLQPGTDYLLEVIDEDTGESSNQEEVKGLGFQLLSSEKSAIIAQTQSKILALPLDAATQSFALAIYYAGQELHGETLRLLDEVVQTQNVPMVHLWRGHMLLATRLNVEAQDAYDEALDLATTLGDVETQAQAQAGLWRTTHNNDHFDAAISLYRQLGDEQAVADLRKERPQENR